MIIPSVQNTFTYGANLTSLGDGQGGNFWRLGAAWSSGTPNNTAVGLSTSWTQISSVQISGGFLNYLVMFSFAQNSGAASTSSKVYAGIGTSPTAPFYNYQIGNITTTTHNAFSGVYIYTATDIGPRTLYLSGELDTGTAPVAFGSITVLGIS